MALPPLVQAQQAPTVCLCKGTYWWYSVWKECCLLLLITHCAICLAKHQHIDILTFMGLKRHLGSRWQSFHAFFLTSIPSAGLKCQQTHPKLKMDLMYLVSEYHKAAAHNTVEPWLLCSEQMGAIACCLCPVSGWSTMLCILLSWERIQTQNLECDFYWVCISLASSIL